jgi:cyanophycinase
MPKSGQRSARRSDKTLVIIGGREDPDGAATHEVVRRVGEGLLVIVTVATDFPEEYFDMYVKSFMRLGLAEPRQLSIRSRAEANDPATLKVLEGAAAVFFTGGDQYRITSQLGDTPVERRIHEIYQAGGLVAGTSAGAAAMCGTMLVRGKGFDSTRGNEYRLATGLGLIQGVVIDQHFAQRGRMARLLGAVARNPRHLGLGIDEDTAIVVENGKRFYVVGTGAVYVIDGSTVTSSNLGDDLDESDALSMHDVRVHVLARGDAFDLVTREPSAVSLREEKRLDDVQDEVDALHAT